ncbi:hypothetical protein QM467_08760 [Rhodoblastus sp. 17X3]|uniref:hypothetical protein n=1 Tax=Rhodoblastus sp. 17X3 TaxID=3047026 RepID=UPI0024B6EC7F|nr:hypothetical protein [Rhodoblastus sp. 17X3]MDI9848139.1 hypothetical protein [Rhodoblastus sp. 17X3]
MTGAPEMRSRPARALASGLDRAEVVRNETILTIASPNAEADFAALFIARRYRLAMPLAQAVAALAGLGRVIG